MEIQQKELTEDHSDKWLNISIILAAVSLIVILVKGQDPAFFFFLGSSIFCHAVCDILVEIRSLSNK